MNNPDSGDDSLRQLTGVGPGGLHAPIPPTSYPQGYSSTDLSMPIPPHLRGR
jgi:hypothetical protein